MSNTDESRDGKSSDAIFQYFKALQRLVEGKPILVDIGTTISLSSVALEAGKSAGSIKKQRPIYAELIKEVKRCASEQKTRAQPNKKSNDAITRWKGEAANWKNLYHQSLARELMLLHQLDEAEHLLRSAENIYQFPSKATTPEPFD